MNHVIMQHADRSMISETFLLCALALPPAYVGKPTITTTAMFRLLSGFWMEHNQGIKPYVLLNSSYSPVADRLRDYGIKAFYISPRVRKSGHSIMGDANMLPFRDESFNIIFRSWHEITIMGVVDAYRSLTACGFFVIESKPNHYLTKIIESFGFELLPFTWGDFTVFQKKIVESSRPAPKRRTSVRDWRRRAA
jgi:hypothetical protein